MARHCSVCRRTGHDRRAHERRNPEFITVNGVVHPIRHGKGVHPDNGQPYDPAKAKGDERVAQRARQVAKGGPAGRKAEQEKRDEKAVQYLLASTKGHATDQLREDALYFLKHSHADTDEHHGPPRGAQITVSPSAYRTAYGIVKQQANEEQAAYDKQRKKWMSRLNDVLRRQRDLYAEFEKRSRPYQFRHQADIKSQYRDLKDEERKVRDGAVRAGVLNPQ